MNQFNAWFDFDITNLVAGWHADPASNKGIVMVPGAGTAGSYWFASAKAAADRRPKLVIDIVIPGS